MRTTTSTLPSALALAILLPLTVALPMLPQNDTTITHQKRDPPSSAITNLGNFPDPSLITVDGTYYAFATNGAAGNIPWGSSNDFKDPSSWQLGGDAMPTLAPWVNPETPNVWAPAVIQFTDHDNSYGIYYTASLSTSPNTHCISLALSPHSPTGPYTDTATHPLICPTSAGGAIDPASFRDADGKWYVVYKEDGPSLCDGGVAAGRAVTGGMACASTALMLQAVDVDGYGGVTAANPAVEIYNNAGAGDGFNVEAPSIVLSSDGSTYFLFFSSGVYDSVGYTVSYVTSTSGVAGPYGERRTLLGQGSFGGLDSPGGWQMQLVDAIAVFHGDAGVGEDGVRYMYAAGVEWEGRGCGVV